MDVSIIVSFYNAEQYLERCLGALRAQQFPEERFEILMVNNNSTDRGEEMVRRYGRARLLHETRQGVYAARNLGISQARGRYLVFLDPDCVPDPGWLEALVKRASEPGVKVVVGRKDHGSDSYALRLLSSYEDAKLQFAFGTRSPALYSGDCATMAVRREVFGEIGPFTEKVRGGDTVLVLAAAERYGCDAVRYESAARVSHLEVRGVSDLYRKMFIYGRSRRRNIGGSMQRPITASQRAALVRRAVRGERPGVVASAMLTVLLAGGVGAFRAGTFTGRWS